MTDTKLEDICEEIHDETVELSSQDRNALASIILQARAERDEAQVKAEYRSAALANRETQIEELEAERDSLRAKVGAYGEVSKLSKALNDRPARHNAKLEAELARRDAVQRTQYDAEARAAAAEKELAQLLRLKKRFEELEPSMQDERRYAKHCADELRAALDGAELSPNAKKLLTGVLDFCEVVMEDGGCSSNYIMKAADDLADAQVDLANEDYPIVCALGEIFSQECKYGIPYPWVRHTLRRLLGLPWAEFVPGSVDAKRWGSK